MKQVSCQFRRQKYIAVMMSIFIESN